jgi:hypothetical protein
MRQRIWIASAMDLGAARTIDAPVWIRAKNLNSIAQDWETLSVRDRRQLLHKVASGLSRHQLFPPMENVRVPAP